MPPKEIDNTDRTLIDRYISLLYAEAFLTGDMRKVSEDAGEQITTAPLLAIRLKQDIDAELFHVRRQMRDRGIKVTNTGKGVFDSLVRGYSHQIVLNADMARMKAEKVLEELPEWNPLPKQERCPKCGTVLVEDEGKMMCPKGDYKEI